jgi:UDP-N-acetylmuramoyl-tripeptide--D-alanyl-D-alanine ligase
VSVLWSALDLARATGGTLTGPAGVDGVSIDSRTLRPGELFVALRGHTDGHAHVGAALARGAACAMVDHVPEGMADEPRLLQVRDTLAGLTDLGAAGRARFTRPVVAVTGSVGKTTTKEMLLLCLSQGGTAHAAEASHNNHWGVPLTLARLPPPASACVVEIGMNHAGEIAPLSLLARPDVAMITTIAAAHVGNLGSLEAIADEKASIGAGLAPGGTMVLPADTPLLDRLRHRVGDHRVISFGCNAMADATLSGLQAAPDHSDITAVVAGQTVAFRLHAPGRHMALNAVGALAAVHACGMDVARAARLLEGFAAGAGRGGKRAIALDAGGAALLLDESYNASSASIRAALAVLALQPARRRVVVLGDMRELGDHSAAEHRGLAEPVREAADLLFTCGPEMRLLYDAVPAGLRGAHAENAEALAPLVAAGLRAGDAVLIKGSYGSRMRMVVAALDAMAGNARAAPDAA